MLRWREEGRLSYYFDGEFTTMEDLVKATLMGRNRNLIKKGMPMTMDLIIVLHDYIIHNLSNVTKKQAKESNIPVVFARRSCSSIYKKLPHCL